MPGRNTDGPSIYLPGGSTDWAFLSSPTPDEQSPRPKQMDRKGEGCKGGGGDGQEWRRKMLKGREERTARQLEKASSEELAVVNDLC